VVDGKHTDCHSATLSATDQTKLRLAAVTLKNALTDKLVAHRTLFFTNRDKEADPDTKSYRDAKEDYHRAFPDGVHNLETIGQATFEFAPFTDILFTRSTPVFGQHGFH
jgi:hypothetical protein